jgi:glycosyltransferase involved in cell wall biosynthesis
VGIRLLFLLTQSLDSPSGLGRYGPLARALARRGHEVEVVALHHDWERLPREYRVQEADGVTVRYVGQMHVLKRGGEKVYFAPPRLLWLTMMATLRLLWQGLRAPAEVIVVGKAQPMNGVAGWLAARLRGLPLWVDVDDHEAASNRFGGRWQQWIVSRVEAWLPRRARWVTTNTVASRERLITEGVSPDAITLLPNGYERVRFAPGNGSRAETGLQDGGDVVLYLGSLSLPSHPVDLLVRAWPAVQERHPGARLLIVGGGEDAAALRELAARLGVEDSVQFVGRVPPEEAAAYYRRAALSIDPVYDDEAARGRSPLKVVESLACGTPVVTGDVGDRAQVVGEAGRVVRAGEPEALAEGILSLLGDPEGLARMRRLAPSQAAGYEWEAMASRVDGMLKATPAIEIAG